MATTEERKKASDRLTQIEKEIESAYKKIGELEEEAEEQLKYHFPSFGSLHLEKFRVFKDNRLFVRTDQEATVEGVNGPEKRNAVSLAPHAGQLTYVEKDKKVIIVLE